MASVAGLDLDLLLLTGELRMRTATGPLKLDELHFVLLQVFLPRTLRGERDVLLHFLWTRASQVLQQRKVGTLLRFLKPQLKTEHFDDFPGVSIAVETTALHWLHLVWLVGCLY